MLRAEIYNSARDGHVVVALCRDLARPAPQPQVRRTPHG